MKSFPFSVNIDSEFSYVRVDAVVQLAVREDEVEVVDEFLDFPVDIENKFLLNRRKVHGFLDDGRVVEEVHLLPVDRFVENFRAFVFLEGLEDGERRGLPFFSSEFVFEFRLFEEFWVKDDFDEFRTNFLKLRKIVFAEFRLFEIAIGEDESIGKFDLFDYGLIFFLFVCSRTGSCGFTVCFFGVSC